MKVRITGQGGQPGTPEGKGADGWIMIEWDPDEGTVRHERSKCVVAFTPLETNMAKHFVATMNCKRRGLWRRGFFGDDRRINRRTTK